MEYNEQKIINHIVWKSEELQEEIRVISEKIDILYVSLVATGLLVGGGMALENAIWCVLGFGLLFYFYQIYRQSKKESKKGKELKNGL